MIWGTTEGNCQEELLSPLGLYSSGGGSLNGKLSYIIYSKNMKNNFKYEIEFDRLKKDIKKVQQAYQKYLRKEKIKKINSLE